MTPTLKLVQESANRASIHLGGGRYIVFRLVGDRWEAHPRRELFGAAPHPWLAARGLPLPDQDDETGEGTTNEASEQDARSGGRSGPATRMFAGALMVPKGEAPKMGIQPWPA